MKTIITAIAIASATIATANAQDKEAHCFKAVELIIEVEVKTFAEQSLNESLAEMDKMITALQSGAMSSDEALGGAEALAFQCGVINNKLAEKKGDYS